ncbi:MAG TPA: hypothetical protein PLO82_10725 [Bacteroidia bacterium]|nr:hypothetical protein [Bacteroidia bacterium]
MNKIELNSGIGNTLQIQIFPWLYLKLIDDLASPSHWDDLNSLLSIHDILLRNIQPH